MNLPVCIGLAILWLIVSPPKNIAASSLISLVEENLAITLNTSTKVSPNMQVQVDFKYSGETKGVAGRTLCFPEDDRTRYRNFRAWIEKDQALKVYRESAPNGFLYNFQVAKYPARYCVKLQKNKKVSRVSAAYEATLPAYYPIGSKGETSLAFVAHYILITGSTWQGPCGALNVFVHTGEILCHKISTTEKSIHGVCTKNNLWEYRSKNIKLDQDLELLIPR